jgi:hypothetical protein
VKILTGGCAEAHTKPSNWFGCKQKRTPAFSLTPGVKAREQMLNLASADLVRFQGRWSIRIDIRVNQISAGCIFVWE